MFVAFKHEVWFLFTGGRATETLMVGNSALKGFAKQQLTLEEVLIECIFLFKLDLHGISWHLVKKQKEVLILK